MTIDAAIDAALKPIVDAVSSVIFFPIPLVDGAQLPVIVGWMALAAIYATLAFRFVNLRYFMHGLRLGFLPKHQETTHAGSISNFQALSAALAGTIGLGNIAGVAVAISVGGPGACIWMIAMGLLGMSTKFMEATLGVKYRAQLADGSYASGPMYYLRDGFAALNKPRLGKILAVSFAVLTLGGAIGGGNMFQANQSFEQFVVVTTDPATGFSYWQDKGWVFGLFMAVLVGIVIIGGIKKIADVSTYLVPAMALIYIAACLVVLSFNAGRLPDAIVTIFTSAFSLEAGLGGFLGSIIAGVRRAVFSNEAGIGSCAIVHGVAKSSHPAEQGMVAMHGAFIDTVIVCTMTALVIVSSGVYDPHTAQSISGITLTSNAFAEHISWFPIVLAFVVFLFAYSTMLTWGYYGATALTFLCGYRPTVLLIYHVIFCLCVVIGAASDLTTVIDLSDAMFFAMTIPNIIGLYVLSRVVRTELSRYQSHLKETA